MLELLTKLGETFTHVYEFIMKDATKDKGEPPDDKEHETKCREEAWSFHVLSGSTTLPAPPRVTNKISKPETAGIFTRLHHIGTIDY